MDLDQEIKKVDPALPDWAYTKRQYKQKTLYETPFAFIIMYKLETLLIFWYEVEHLGLNLEVL